jgi:hypothetical protein
MLGKSAIDIEHDWLLVASLSSKLGGAFWSIPPAVCTGNVFWHDLLLTQVIASALLCGVNKGQGPRRPAAPASCCSIAVYAAEGLCYGLPNVLKDIWYSLLAFITLDHGELELQQGDV